MTDVFHFQVRASTLHRSAVYRRKRFIACEQWIPAVYIGSIQVFPSHLVYKTHDKALAAANRYARKIMRQLVNAERGGGSECIESHARAAFRNKDFDQ